MAAPANTPIDGNGAPSVSAMVRFIDLAASPLTIATHQYRTGQPWPFASLEVRRGRLPH